MKGLEIDKVITRCPREHPKDTSGHVTSRGSPTGDVWWRHFRSKDSNREKPPTSGCACEHPTFARDPWWRHFQWNGPLGRILRNFRLHMRTSHPSKGIPSGWRDVCWRHFRWKGPNRTDIVQLPVKEPPSGSCEPLQGQYYGKFGSWMYSGSELESEVVKKLKMWIVYHLRKNARTDGCTDGRIVCTNFQKRIVCTNFDICVFIMFLTN